MSFWGLSKTGKDAQGWANEYGRFGRDVYKNRLGDMQENVDQSKEWNKLYGQGVYDTYQGGSSFLNQPFQQWTNTIGNIRGDANNMFADATKRVDMLQPAGQAAVAQNARSWAPAYSNMASRLRGINPNDPQYQAAMGRLDSARARSMDDTIADRTAGWVNARNQVGKEAFQTDAALQQQLAQGGIDQALQKYGVEQGQLKNVGDWGQTQGNNAQMYAQLAHQFGEDAAASMMKSYQMEAANAGWGTKLLTGAGMAALNMFAPGFGTSGFSGFKNPFGKGGGASSGLQVAGLFGMPKN